MLGLGPTSTCPWVHRSESNSHALFRSRRFVRNRDGNHYGVEFITENDEDYRKAGELQAGLAAMNADVSVS